MRWPEILHADVSWPYSELISLWPRSVDFSNYDPRLITRVSEVIMFSTCVFVCLCLYHDNCPDDLTMEDWCHTNNSWQVHCWGCLVVSSYVSRTHDVIDDVTRSQSRSNFEIDISPSICELERRSKAQNIGNANGYLSGIFNFRCHFRWKSLSRAQNDGHFENFEILNADSIWPQIWKDCPKTCHKKYFSRWWRHRVAEKSAFYIPL